MNNLETMTEEELLEFRNNLDKEIWERQKKNRITDLKRELEREEKSTFENRERFIEDNQREAYLNR